MALNLREKAFQFLSTNPEVKYTARQIAEWIFESFPVECNEKRGKSKASVLPIITDADLIQQLIAEIGAQRPDLQKKYPAVKTTEERPRKYYFSSKTDEEQITNELSEIPVLTQYNEYSEHEFYEKVFEYLK